LFQFVLELLSDPASSGGEHRVGKKEESERASERLLFFLFDSKK
jgi:hypothetical protein